MYAEFNRSNDVCNRYEIDTDGAALALYFQAQMPLLFEWSGEITNFGDEPAPTVLRNDEGARELHPMQFSLTPPWSKERRVKFATNNCRVEDIEKKKTFMGSFSKHRCLVPMSRFREPCYWGEPAGKEVWFEPAGKEILGAAAIYSLWRSPDRNEELLTMSLLMRPAGQYVMEHGHHRQPIFLEPEGYDVWMQAGVRESAESKRILREFAIEPEFTWRVTRDMALSWTKRRKAKLKNRDDQIAAIEQTGQLGF